MGRIASGRNPERVFVPFSGKGTAGIIGNGVIAGTTQGTDLGLAILSTGQFVDTLGWLRGATLTANDSVQAGTTWTYVEIELPWEVLLNEAEYDQTVANAVSVASTSGTTVTITSDENNADCGWLYAVSGTGAGKLAFCTAQTSGTATTKTATGWDSTTKVIKIQRFGHKLMDIQTGVTVGGKIKSAAAAATGTVFIFEEWFEDASHGRVLLNPTIHDNLTLVNPHFYCKFAIRGAAGL